MNGGAGHPITDDLLEGLTQAQAEAVRATEGPVLVLAGPGSGKTRVITRRMAYLIARGVPPWSILAVTFTNKAAGEMKHRVGALIGNELITGPRGPTVTTFHSLCVRLLRRYAELAAADGHPIVDPGFSVYDDDDQMRLIKRVIADCDLSTSNFSPRTVLSAISAAKNELKDAERFKAEAQDFYARTLARCYEKYQAELRGAKAVDFDDLLVHAANMLRRSERVRAEVRRRYRYLLVDEYQDTNKAQFVIASLIAGEEGPRDRGIKGSSEHGADARSTDPLIPRSLPPTPTPTPPPTPPNICVVGDPDQSIYGWRGADLRNILQFEEQYPSARVIALGENFRSLPSILSAADRLIRRNARRKHKPLIAVRGTDARGAGAGAGPRSAGPAPVEVVICRDERHEASLALDFLKLHRERMGLEWKDCAVMYRTNALSRVIEEHFRNAGVPYVLVRGTAFYQREEIKDALAYLRVLANPADGVSLERIINKPARGISDATWEKIAAAAQAEGVPALQVLRTPARLPGLTPRAAGAVGKFTQMLDTWHAEGEGSLLTSEVGRLPELVERIVRESGLEKHYGTEEERLENLSELVSSAREFEESFNAQGDEELDVDPDTGEPKMVPRPDTLTDLLRAYLERVALVSDSDAIDPRAGAVTLMTLHAAKGLEYRCVALLGFEEGVLPHIRSQESEDALEEERRLAFVGITRAMDRLLITSANYRTVRGIMERTIPSRFLDELRGEGVIVSDQGDAFGASGQGGGGGGGGGGGFGGASFGGGGAGVRDFLAGGRAARGGRPASTPSDGERRVVVDDDAQVAPTKVRGPGGMGEFALGQRVRHPQFGPGTIEAVFAGAEPRVKVKFAQAGTKTLVLAYARLTRA
jgi:DNA helicase-2/ATP-dependent DNA helicase PcrA